MKRITTTFWLLASLGLTSVMAQSGYKTYDFAKCEFNLTDEEGYTFKSPLYGYFSHVSANGRYAVGTDDELMFRSYLWCIDTPNQIQMFGDYTSEVALYDVTNDGTLVGGIRDSRGVMYPAYKPIDANWQMLTRGMENLNKDMAMDDYVNMALRAATPDGRYMAGSFYMNTGEQSSSGWEVSHLVPVVWEDGKLLKVYDDLGISEFMVWDISDDGSIICGMNTSGIGGQNPAFIRNGQLIELFDCGDERTEDTPDDVYGNTAGGICNSIDNEGNIYGYYAESDGDYMGATRFFVVPADCDFAVFLDPSYTNDKFPEDYWDMRWYRCGGNGRSYTNDDSHLYSLLDCSDDGRVFVGGGAADVGFGIANKPMVCIYDEPLAPVSIRTVADAMVDQGVMLAGHSLVVKGLYTEASVFDAKGALVAKGTQGQPITMPAGHGVFVANVKYADGVHSYKLTK